MSDTLRNAIAQRRKDIQCQLEVDLARSISTQNIARSLQELTVLKDLLSEISPREERRWLLPLSIVLISISLIALALSIRLPAPEFELDAKITSITFASALGGTEFGSGKSIDITSLEVAGDADMSAAVADVVAIDSIELQPMTDLVLSTDGKRCFLAEVSNTQSALQSDTQFGLRLVVRKRTKSVAGAVLDEFMIGPGMAIRFCAPQFEDYLLLGKVGRVDVSKIHRDSLPPIYTSSISSGMLTIGATGEKLELGSNDRLSFRDIDDGWLIISFADEIRVRFSGWVSTARAVGIMQNNSQQDLSPTFLDWITRSPKTASIFGFVTGLVGMLWSACRYLGFSSR